ncbi:MAG: Na+/H+ antiporter subunit E [Oscillospiraceae bacterium]|nr:Na+/H+ antiporter subunit E [Oscillospiraceae bacterium]
MITIRKIGVVIALTLVWIVLREEIGIATIVQGVVVSIGCLYFSNRFFPLDKMTDASFHKLILYPFYLIWQVYLNGFLVMRMIIKGARVDVIELETSLKSAALKAILGDSINLTPGTLLIDFNAEKMPMLWLRPMDDPASAEGANAAIRDGFETRLKKAEK